MTNNTAKATYQDVDIETPAYLPWNNAQTSQL